MLNRPLIWQSVIYFSICCEKKLSISTVICYLLWKSYQLQLIFIISPKFEKRSRILLKKLYFIVLFAFRLMSIKYTLTCVRHMWACNTTRNRNNEKMHIRLFFWKNPLLSLSKRGRWSESFSYNRFKTTKVNNKYYCIHFNDEKIILRFVFY